MKRSNEAAPVRQRSLESRWDQVGEFRIHARHSVPGVQAPDAPPLVLVHGLGVSSRYWSPTAELLAARHRVYAIDLPGFGLSSHPARTLGIRELGDALASWMRALELREAVLLGNSFGCQIITDLVLRERGHAQSLVLISPTVDRHARTVVRQLLRLVRDVPREPLSLIPIVARDYLSAGLYRAWRTLRFAVQDRIEKRLREINLPVLVVGGGRDPLAAPRWVAEVASLLPQGRLAMLDAAAHAVNYNSPEPLAAVIEEWCEARNVLARPSKL